MNSLKYNFRNVPVKYDKRALCEMNILYDILNQAINEKFTLYMLVYAYKNQLFSVGYENINNQIKFYYGTDDGNSIELNTIEELKAKTNYEGKVTVLRELQSYDNNIVPSFGVQTGAYAAKLFLNSMQESDNIIEMSIRDNFILKNFLVSSENDNFNYNLSPSQIEEFNNLLKESENNNKETIFILVGCVIFIVVVIILAAIFGK